MSGKLCSLLALAVLLGSISCAQPEPVAEEAAPAPAPVAEVAELDPVVADPDHYAVEFENDRVRILRIVYGPGEESAMHAHPNSAAVFLTDALAEMTTADGSTEELSVSAGQAVFPLDSTWEGTSGTLRGRSSRWSSNPAQAQRLLLRRKTPLLSTPSTTRPSSRTTWCGSCASHMALERGR